MYQNNLTREFQKYLNKPVNYMNNQILNNNPLYMSNIHDQSFYQRMMSHKDEEIRKIKNVSELGMSKEQIIEYVIAPLKIEKSDSNEIKRLYDDESNKYTEKYIEKNWWAQRTNAPYKNILKEENWKKEIKSGSDLIVHKVTNLDKLGLEEDYIKLQELLENHDGELKVIFSASKESEYKKSFKFVQKYKYRMKYDPKDYNDLKNYYKNEQKKHDRDQKRFDEIIGLIMEDDKIDEKELKQIESEFFKPSTKAKKNKKSKNTTNEMEEQIQEMIEMYGEDDIKKILKELDNDSDTDNDKNNDKNNDKKHKNKNNDKNKNFDKNKNNDNDDIRHKDKQKQKKYDIHKNIVNDKQTITNKQIDKNKTEKHNSHNSNSEQSNKKEIRKVLGISIRRENINDENNNNAMVRKNDENNNEPKNKPNNESKPKLIEGIRIGNKTNIY